MSSVESTNADYLQLAGKVCLVTGGSRGMGECTVRRFAAEGATVIAADILDDEGKALAARSIVHHGRAAPMPPSGIRC